MLTFARDQFILDTWEDTPRWVVTLNDCTNVYQDDDRPDRNGRAWQELREYCRRNSLFITNMHIEFRDHIERLPDDKMGYFFSNAAGGSWGGPTFRYFKVGYVEGNVIHVTKYQVPELIVIDRSTREIVDDDLCLITMR